MYPKECSYKARRVKSPRKSTVGILFNPISGAGRSRGLAESASAALTAAGFLVHMFETRDVLSREHPMEFFGSVNFLVLSGGDGTLMAVLPYLTKLALPVYMLPAGNESLFAREFGMQADTSLLIAALSAGEVLPASIGHVGDKPFLTMVSLGLDSQVIELIDSTRTGAIGHLGYLLPTLRAFFRHKAPVITLRVDGEGVVSNESGFLIIANTKGYARRLLFVPEATSADDVLRARFFPYGGSWGFLGLVLKLMLGRPASSIQGARFFSGKQFEISTGGETGYPVQADGEYVGKTPVVVRGGEGQILVLKMIG